MLSRAASSLAGAAARLSLIAACAAGACRPAPAVSPEAQEVEAAPEAGARRVEAAPAEPLSGPAHHAAAHPSEPPEHEHPELPERVLAPDCQRWVRVQERVAALGFHLLALGGRLDPGAITFSGTGAARKVALAPLPALTEEAKQTLAGAVDAINGEPEAVEVLAEHHLGALRLCRENGGCRSERYQFTTKPLKGATPNDKIYQWVVSGEKYPTAFEWRVYEALYARPPELCPVLRSLRVETRASGLAQIDGMFTPIKPPTAAMGHLNPCKCFLNGEHGRGTRPNCTEC